MIDTLTRATTAPTPAAPAAAGPQSPANANAPAGAAPATVLHGRHLLGIADLTREEIVLILDTAEAMKEVGSRAIKKVPALRGRTVVNLFFEPSTRTRTSFEIAEKRLSADTLNIAVSTSSVTKGETLADTVRNLEALSPDMIVMRHASSGACHLLARICKSRIINAGDGMHEHPTQALLDAFTIREHKKRIAGLKVVIVGDLLHSRVLRSNVLLLNKLGANVWVCAPRTLMPAGIDQFGVTATTNLDEAVKGADVVMMLRIQLERMQSNFFPSIREYFNLFGLTPERVKLAKDDVIIMHPGPMNRGVEIASEVADGASSVILEQVSNGVAVRMAVLYLLAGGGEA
jgi:aspartate carbamoyltransferase catalytic subunit